MKLFCGIFPDVALLDVQVLGSIRGFHALYGTRYNSGAAYGDTIGSEYVMEQICPSYQIESNDSALIADEWLSGERGKEKPNHYIVHHHQIDSDYCAPHELHFDGSQ